VSDAVEPDMLGVLRRLGRTKGGRVPYVQQLEAADCGAACLAMVAGYHGNAITLDQARTVAGRNRGTDALSIMQGAEQIGLRARGVRIELPELRHLPRGSILHWDFSHFVVLDRVHGSSVDVVDPAFGRRALSIEQLGRHFTGVALVFEPSQAFVATPPGRSKVLRYLGHLAAHPGLVARVLVTTVALRVLALALPVFTALIVDRVVPRGDHDLLYVVGGGIAVTLAFQLLANLIRAHFLIELRTRLDVSMTMGFVTRLLSLPYAFFHRRSVGDLLLRVASNTFIRDLLTSSLLATLLDGALAAAYLALLLWLSPLLALVTLAVAVLQLAVLLLSRHHYARLTSQDLESQARAHSYLVQMLVGIETLKVAGAESRALEQWGNLYIDELNVSLQRSRMKAVVDAVTSLLQTGAPLALLGVGAVLVLKGQLSLGAMLATTALATGFLTPFASLIESALQLQLLGSYVERIDDVLAAEPEQVRESLVAPPRLTGAIEVQNVSFRYGPNDPLVVRDVSLTVAPGATVAIVGRSGSGKSTLAALLLGIHRPTEGRIIYDGYDLAELDRKRIRRQFGMVPQSPFIFSGSVRSNIALTDPSLSLDRVVAAARRAGIDADIRAMAMGYDTPIADGGATLSGGQRQRLALARALVHDPAVLLLDEATSSLDATTERAVMDALRALRATRIIIAHRLSTIVRADRILVMQDGRIVESGTHGELMERRGVYAELVADQSFAMEAMS
jgi:ABC-type bacteriocin/lantibiotic exporter with double-glycine peptidase domain